MKLETLDDYIAQVHDELPDPQNYQNISDALNELAYELSGLGEHYDEVQEIESAANSVEYLADDDAEIFVFLTDDNFVKRELRSVDAFNQALAEDNESVVMIPYYKFLKMKGQILDLLRVSDEIAQYKKRIEQLEGLLKDKEAA